MLFGQVRINEALDQAAALSMTRHNQQVDRNPAILKRLTVAVLYLGRQEQAVWGHSEAANEGATRAFAEFDTTLTEHLASATKLMGLSKTIQNEITESTAHAIQGGIDKEITTGV